MMTNLAQQVPKDVWGIIGEELGVRDLLSLRQTCQRLNVIVIGMQARWYRAHQWFLAKHNGQSKVKSAVRVHNTRLSRHCVPNNFPYPGKLPTHSYYDRIAAHQKLIDDGEFQESDCKAHHHWKIRVPKSEHDIPLDTFFKPKKCNYIYYYLIESYRKRAPLHSNVQVNLARETALYKREIAECERKIKRRLEQISQNEKKLEEEKLKFIDNRIFEGYAVNSYKTPAGASRKRVKPSPKCGTISIQK